MACLERRRTLVQYYNVYVSRDVGTESKLFAGRRW